MKSRSTYLLIALAVLAILTVLYWRMLKGPKRFDWRDAWVPGAYSESSRQPYGTQILYRLLHDYFPEHRFVDVKENVAEELPVAADSGTYVCVGEALFLDSLSTARLLDFVRAGNTAFLSSKTIPFDLMFHLYYEECPDAVWNDYELFSDSVVTATLPRGLLPSAVPLHYARQNRKEEYRWSFIESRFFCAGLPQHPLGYLNDSLVNFAEFSYGEGRVYLHTTPIALSNYHLLRPQSRLYAEALLSYLPEGDIYWDTYSRVPEMVGRMRNQEGGNQYSRQLPAEHPLSYILRQPPLAWAWYLLIALALLYLIFRAKRRQRIIPVLPRNENSSYEFIRTIANLHFREKNYQNLCIQNMRLFLAQIRERYSMVAQLDPDTLKPRLEADFIDRLGQVSEVPVRQIQDIFTQYAAAVQYDPTEDMLVQLHLSMDAFWKKAK
ncbi:MAG: DUF4350 domain-containing protein [Bacteroidetes bacterium]|nr:MAG: DUF4350 domain-containing protein [Bacteroidota bacterium]